MGDRKASGDGNPNGDSEKEMKILSGRRSTYAYHSFCPQPLVITHLNVLGARPKRYRDEVTANVGHVVTPLAQSTVGRLPGEGCWVVFV